MRFYVPTIGDKLYLKQPWTFTLHKERRNESLAKRMPHLFPMVDRQRSYWRRKMRSEKRGSLWSSWTDPQVVPADTAIHNSDTVRIGEYHCNPGDEGAYEHIHRWKELDWNNGTREITLPAKTELVVDRIYIRKGAPSYDSITFYIEGCPDEAFSQGKKKSSGGFGGKGRARFWVKLKDANKIDCELTPIFDEEARQFWATVSDRRFEEIE